MKWIKSILIGVIMLQLIVLAWPIDVKACSCPIPEDAIRGLELSDAVFTGKVKQIKKTNIDNENYDAVLIEVNEIWKGFTESQIIIYTSWSSCQFDFVDGEEYLLYSYEVDGKFFVMNCGRSSRLSNASVDIEQLGEGKKPSHIVNLTLEFNMKIWLTGVIITAFIVAVIYVYRRIRSRKS